MSRLSLIGTIATASIALSAGQALAQVSCGTTIMQNTTLTRDLNNCQDQGIIIGAAGITLDLGGHTIDGDGEMDAIDIGVDNTAGHAGVTIKNGRIREFVTAGVSLKGAAQNTLSELVVSYNFDGISLENSNNNQIERNTTSDNDNDGILINNSDDNQISRNSSFDNENFGIAIENNSDGTRIRRNEANNNGHLNGNSGILIDGTSTRTTIENNVANWNKLDGISVGNVVTTSVEDNTANNNGQWGINVVASGADRGGNRARNNGNAGQCQNVAC